MRNRSILPWVILAFILLFVSRVHSAPPEFQPVCQIQESGGFGSGTLVAVNDTTSLILTVRHVVGTPGRSEKFNWPLAGSLRYSGKTLANYVDKYSKEWEASDLALAVCPRVYDKFHRAIAPATLASFDLSEGPWYGVGFVSRKLTVVKVTRCSKEGSLLTFNHMFIPGMSGGPVFNNKGEVVGVISSYNQSYDMGVAIDGPNLKKLLAKYGQQVD